MWYHLTNHLLSLLTTAGVKFKEEDANSKLNSKQLHKLGIRLVGMFNLELGKAAITATSLSGI